SAAVEASFARLEERYPLIRVPKANSTVAPSMSQGRRRMKVCAGVLNSKYAPLSPPTTLVTMRGTITRRDMLRRLRYAPPLAVVPTHSATVLLAFAAIGGTPVKSNAGNATKLAPPAPAFSTPPNTPANKMKMAEFRSKQTVYHMAITSEQSLQANHAYSK